MTNKDADRIRAKQDRLLALAKSSPREYRISADYPGSPTLEQLERYVFPEWETLVDRMIRYLTEDKD
ncbi:hypothetical protein LCGC14_1570910 [marine sediment metagenome]|uniref:Uncharacterized protein n=1 Tax=marine sediment metagenome TaxID=412755 RepID=A0A0F9IJN1_9ZZZZ